MYIMIELVEFPAVTQYSSHEGRGITDDTVTLLYTMSNSITFRELSDSINQGSGEAVVVAVVGYSG